MRVVGQISLSLGKMAVDGTTMSPQLGQCAKLFREVLENEILASDLHSACELVILSVFLFQVAGQVCAFR